MLNKSSYSTMNKNSYLTINKLFSAYLARLGKSSMFWGLLLLAAGFGVIVPVIAHYEMLKYGVTYSSESRLAWHAVLTGFFTALFTSWFLGTEYSDGTIRNKLIAGHTRKNIYLAFLGTCVLAHTVILILHMLVISVAGQWLIAPFEMNAGNLMLFYLLSLLNGIAFTSLYTMLVMLNQNKSAGLMFCVLVCLVLFMVAFYIYAMLAAPEMVPKGYAFSIDGTVVSQGMEPNPRYVRGMRRTVYEWIFNILPFGQSIRLAEMNMEGSLRMVLCNLCLTAGTTFAGLYCFERKDLR